MARQRDRSLRKEDRPRSLATRPAERADLKRDALRAAVRRIFRHDGWRIGLARGDPQILLREDMPRIEWLHVDCPPGFVADPFLIEDKGLIYCFFEYLPYSTKRGRICFVLLSGAAPGKLMMHEAISAPHHLSYPYLLRHGDEVLCIPEAGSTGHVQVYATRRFPTGWYLKGTLIANFAGVDSTILRHADRWWLFATDARTGADSDLCIWSSDALFGGWEPHRANPVRTGLAGTRPAGAPFSRDGRLYRPAQDCAKHYGHRIVINEILELSRDTFRERAVGVIAPDPQGPCPDGLHSVNSLGDLIVVDGNRFRFVPRLAAREVISLGRRFGGFVVEQLRTGSSG